MSPAHALGVRFRTSPLPRSLESPRSPHPAFRDVCPGGSGDPDGSLPAPLALSTLARLLLLSFLHGRSAKGLRKLPAPSPSRAPSWGPGHTPIEARPCPCHSGLPTPSPGPLTPHSDSTELAAPRAAPSGGRVGRSSSPSRTLELHAGTRRLAAGGAKLHTRRLLRPRREGLGWAAAACRGPGSANS